MLKIFSVLLTAFELEVTGSSVNLLPRALLDLCRLNFISGNFTQCYNYRDRYISVGRATSYGLTVRGWNPGFGEIFHTCPDRPWRPFSLLYNGYRDSFFGGKVDGSWL